MLGAIISILVEDGDISAFKGSYPYNLALRRAAERHARECHSTTLEWANPVREGVTEGLYDLTNGTYLQYSIICLECCNTTK
jgi:hypothetical protein